MRLRLWPAALYNATVVTKHDLAKREHVVEGFNVLGHRPLATYRSRETPSDWVDYFCHLQTMAKVGKEKETECRPYQWRH